MNTRTPLPSSSNFSNFLAKKKKAYVPNLTNARNRQARDSAACDEIKREETNAVNREKNKFRRADRTLLAGAETFAPAVSLGSSRVSVKGTGKTRVSTTPTVARKGSTDKDAILSVEVPTKSVTGKFAQISSASPRDLPISVPRPMLPLDDDKESLSLLKDILDPSGEESPLFILKLPKYLPVSSDSTKNSKDDDKENEKSSLHELPEGEIGTLQITQSGRLRLSFGKCVFWLHRGVRVNCKEQLAFVTTEEENKTGVIVDLGNIRDRLTAVPESFTALKND